MTVSVRVRRSNGVGCQRSVVVGIVEKGRGSDPLANGICVASSVRLRYCGRQWEPLVRGAIRHKLKVCATVKGGCCGQQSRNLRQRRTDPINTLSPHFSVNVIHVSEIFCLMQLSAFLIASLYSNSTTIVACKKCASISFVGKI